MAHMAAQALIQWNIIHYEALPTAAFMAVTGHTR
jgi:hypothetical protein